MGRTISKGVFLVICILLQSGHINTCWANAHVSSPSIKKGVLDCRNWDFEQNGNITLRGEWEFYWNKLLNPKNFENTTAQGHAYAAFPQLWRQLELQGQTLPDTGYATYRLIILTEGPIKSPLALEIPDCYSAYRFWLNGEIIAENGQVGKDRKHSSPHWLPNTKTIQLKEGQNELLLQVSNFHHSKGGVNKATTLGLASNLHHKKKIEFSSILVLAGSLIMGSLFFLGLYLFGQREKAVLYFSLFCLVYCYRILGTDLYVLHDLLPGLDWAISTKLEYVTLFLSVSLFGEFLSRVFSGEFSTRLIRIVHVANTALITFTLLFPAIYYTRTVNPYLASLFIFILYASFILVRALIKKREGADFAVLSFVALFATFLLSMLDYFTVSQFGPLLSFFGYTLFFFFQSLILSRKFAVSFQKAVNAAEEGARAKADFLATMSHEIRTPMNGMIGMTSLLSQTKLTEEQRKFTETIRVCGENLMTIINDILDFSKIEAQNMELEFQPFALKSAVNEIVELFSVQSAKKSLSIIACLESDVPDFVVGDVTRIKQVIINLVNNAIKFTDKGEIRIRISQYANTTTEGRIQLLFQVEDTGIGIEESKISRLFTAFSQVDSSIARKYGGTGLGLAICQKLVHLMNGRIWVDSKQGEGSVFSFTSQFSLPTAAEIEKLQPRPKAERAPKGLLSDQLPLRILVAEDNAINMQLILHLLKKLGYVADAAGNGQEAVDAVERQTYDIIFMDMQMPVMDGLDASRQIVTKYPENLRPTIIALTANVSHEDKENCLAAGMTDFITKPLKPGIVRETLIKWGKTNRGTLPRRATS